MSAVNEKSKELEPFEHTRLNELRDVLPKPLPLHAYNFDIDGNQVKLKYFRDIELDLQGLDPNAWTFLKSEIIPLLVRKDSERGWRDLFDRFNEAKGYNYLKRRLSCVDVTFIPRSPIRGQKTPDIMGTLNGTKVLCDVKTVNISKVELGARKNGSRTILTELDVGFFKKLQSDLETAKEQMDSYCPGESVKEIAYIVVNFDDILHEYRDKYLLQIDKFLSGSPVSGLEIVIDSKPAFYSATP